MLTKPYEDVFAEVQAVDNSSYKKTYSASVIGLAPALTATDIFIINGSATKTIRIKKIQVAGLATAAGAYSVVLAKRSTANAAGTSTAPTVVPRDSADAAGTAVVLAYTANPTPGTLVGNLDVQKLTVTTAAGAIPIVPYVFEAFPRGEKEIVLRGVAQGLAVNLNGVSMAGGSLDISVTWTEE